MTGSAIDFAALMPDVARALLGKPTSSTRTELRYGRRGSLSVRLDTGTWFDHEGAAGGGVLDLVKRETGALDNREAIAWLRDAGLLDGQARPGAQPPRKAPGRDSGPIPAPDPGVDARIRLARVLWAATAPTDDSPGRVYLAGRRAWPGGDAPDSAALPESMRWLARERAPTRDPAAQWYGLPGGAAGALVFAYRPMPAPEPMPAAVSLLAVSAAGERVTWFGKRAVKVRTVGSPSGLAFTARPGPAGEPLHVAEGEVTALALAAAPWCGPGAIVAAGGTSGLRNVQLPRCFHTVIVMADRDANGAGQLAAADLAERLEAEGRRVRIELPPFLGDWNDVLVLAREGGTS